ncbi:SAM-dependent methyltransferase [Siphonobacter sp. BAB-5385]|uniref:BREX-1 system adenine-specific DNA-methyltransferase PglX n=1 Tax=Siphonobacter sp. BAB-5385 TaxID=1864822 RepID=UPI000B9DEA63|nr:BREX-1 system adenine-specific DNA-methyltransferase PglX [Siphonobacter sp. BAB-5385]OZI05704.1 SAM-dependent methyltransferase [Siphonobacter sp. BAB-5385]
MNTNSLKKFAQEARKKLITQVGSRLDYVLGADSAELRERAAQVKKLNDEIARTSREQVVEKVAYTWFNRLMALRFMDANDYQPIGIRVVTPRDGFTTPEILEEAKSGQLHTELPVDTSRIHELLNGKIPSANPQNEVYKLLLIAACNHLHKALPFLFERIDDYTDLLIPDDLTSEFSIVHDVCTGMSVEDCNEVEIIGWLYQFYVAELNEKLISSKKVYKKEELAPASQLFTPKWIVQYMVDNTLGQLILELFPNSKINESLEFYIKPEYSNIVAKRESKRIEEIKFFEPCVGSGHILSYAFDVFYKAYEEQGYSNSEIPELIIRNNLFGVDIDPRAAQMASLVLMMKGRQYYRRFFRSVEKNNFSPNIFYYTDFKSDSNFKNATVLGSLIRISQEEANAKTIYEGSLFAEGEQYLKHLYNLLSTKYDVVVTNPPYISSSRMEGSLKQYVEKTWPETKSDLFATFILRCLEFCKEDGFTGYMTPFVWMFISSYEKLRSTLINKHVVHSLIQLEYSGFDGATVPICTFTLRNKFVDKAKGSYIRLSDFKGSQNQAPKTREAIQNPKCGWFYTANQKDFEKIPGAPIGYWLSENAIDSFLKNKLLGEELSLKAGLSTGDNTIFQRKWYEIENKNISFNTSNLKETRTNNKKWYPCHSGGDFRKWFGNHEVVINWLDDGNAIRNYRFANGKVRSAVRNEAFYFKSGITWSKISSGKFAARARPAGFIFDDTGRCGFSEDPKIVLSALGVMSSVISNHFLEVLCPTLSFTSGELAKIPFVEILSSEQLNIVEQLVNCSKTDWDSTEKSWNFKENAILKNRGFDIEESYNLYKQYWTNKFFQLHKNEQELNRQLIEIYGLQKEMTPDVPLDEITILQQETKIVNGQLVFDQQEVIAQFVSYAVGCMFGRYSLDQEGLILANQGETLEDFLTKVQKSEAGLSFVPDADNVIPVLDEEWFEDDIVGRFYAFLKASFGTQNFAKNLAFVETSLGKDIRKYFVKDFYADHIQRYKKRPIYWMFSSPKGSFNVLIYMHRYRRDTLSKILNDYLNQYREKLRGRLSHLEHLMVSGSPVEQNKATRESDKIKLVLLELQEYERDILYPLASERIGFDLDDGVLVNYNKFGKAIKEVKGLNDKVTKQKVREFDWIDTTQIR